MFSFAISLFDGLADYFDVWRYAEFDDKKNVPLHKKHTLDQSQLEECES